MLLAGRQEGTQSVKTSASKPLRMSVNVSWCSVAPGTPWTTLPAYLNKDMKRDLACSLRIVKIRLLGD